MALIASMMASSVSCLVVATCSWITFTRSTTYSLSVWHCPQACSGFSSGLCTSWLENFEAPSRTYGMWQSAQATPAW